LKTKQTGNLRAVAHIRKVFGVKGEVKIFSYARSSDEYRNLQPLFRGKTEQDAVVCIIENVTMRGNDIYVKMEGIDDRTAAEGVIGQYVFVEEKHRKKLPPGKFFDDDILDCTIVSEEGKKFGTVYDVIQYPAHKVYVVTTKRGYVMMPAVAEIIRSVDIEKKEIVVRPPEGLFDGTMLE
jgi:16S rRNA processing protein RimM